MERRDFKHQIGHWNNASLKRSCSFHNIEQQIMRTLFKEILWDHVLKGEGPPWKQKLKTAVKLNQKTHVCK